MANHPVHWRNGSFSPLDVDVSTSDTIQFINDTAHTIQITFCSSFVQAGIPLEYVSEITVPTGLVGTTVTVASSAGTRCNFYVKGAKAIFPINGTVIVSG